MTAVVIDSSLRKVRLPYLVFEGENERKRWLLLLDQENWKDDTGALMWCTAKKLFPVGDFTVLDTKIGCEGGRDEMAEVRKQIFYSFVEELTKLGSMRSEEIFHFLRRVGIDWQRNKTHIQRRSGVELRLCEVL